MPDARILVRVVDAASGRRVPEFERRVDLQPLWDLDSFLQFRGGRRLEGDRLRSRDAGDWTEIALDAPATVLYRVGLQWGHYPFHPEEQFCVLRPAGEARVEIPLTERRVGQPVRVVQVIRAGWARRDAAVSALLGEGRFGAVRGRLVRPRTDRDARTKIHVFDAGSPLPARRWSEPPDPGHLMTELLFGDGESELDWIAVPVRPGRKRVFVVDPPAASWSTDVDVSGGGVVDLGIVKPPPATGRFQFQVVDPDGQALKGLSVHARGRDPAYDGVSGDFRLQLGLWSKEGPEPVTLEPIPPETSRLRIEVWRFGDAPVKATVELRDGSHTLTLAPTKSTGFVAGRVVDDRGEWVPGYSLMPEPVRLYSGCSFSPDGGFRVVGLDASVASVKLQVACPGYETATTDVPMNADDLRIVLRRTPPGP